MALTQEEAKLLKILRAIKWGKKDPTRSVCQMIWTYHDYDLYIPTWLREWPKYTGGHSYFIVEIGQYDLDADNGTCWTGESGERRREWLTWAINQLEKKKLKKKKKLKD